MQAAFQSIKVWACVCVTRNSCCTKQCYLNTFESRLCWRGHDSRTKSFTVSISSYGAQVGLSKGQLWGWLCTSLWFVRHFFFLPTRHARTQGLTGQRKQGDSHNKAAQREICQQLKGVCATSKHYLPMFQSKASTLSDTHTQTPTHNWSGAFLRAQEIDSVRMKIWSCLFFFFHCSTCFFRAVLIVCWGQKALEWDFEIRCVFKKKTEVTMTWRWYAVE